MRTELLKKMYKTISCKYATIALACHLHSYNKKTKEHNQKFFYGAFFKLYKITTLSCSLQTKWRWSVSVYTPTGATDRGLSR